MSANDLSRDAAVSVIAAALEAEYGGYQYPAAERIATALEDEGFSKGWDR